MSSKSREWAEGQRIRDMVMHPQTPTQHEALEFLQEQEWVRQGTRLVSADTLQQEKLEVYFEALGAQHSAALDIRMAELKSDKPGAKELRAGWEISMNGRAAEALLKENGLELKMARHKGISRF